MTDKRTDLTLPFFLECLKESGVLSAASVAALAKQVPSDTTPAVVAEALVKRSVLTQWQAESLLCGKAKRLRLGKYLLLEPINQGKQSVIFKAMRQGLERVVALKILPQQFTSDRTKFLRFQRGCKALAVLQHPHIVSVFDLESVGDTHFLVMEFVSGKNLRGWLRETDSLSASWSATVILQIASALDAAHSKGMVHRDIKPTNIMVHGAPPNAGPEAKLLDLGHVLQQQASGNVRLTVEGEMFGSVDYISPEQAEDTRTVDIRSDIYSLGTVFFELLTRKLPYSQGSNIQRMIARARRDAPRVSELREVPQPLDDVVARMLERDPSQRYQTPAELTADLDPVVRLLRQTDIITPRELDVETHSGDLTITDAAQRERDQRPQ